MTFDSNRSSRSGGDGAGGDPFGREARARRSRGSRRSRLAGRWIVILAGAAVVVAAAIAALVLLGSGGASLERAIEQFRAGRYAVAEQTFAHVLERDAKNVTALLYLSRIQRRGQAYAEAAENLRDAARIAPRDQDVNRELGYLFLDLGRPGPAIERFELALEDSPDEDANWIGLVRALRAAGDPHADTVLNRAPAAVRAVLAANG